MFKRLFIAFILVGFLSFPVLGQEPVYTEGVLYQVEVLEDGYIQVRKATRIYKDGIEISKSYHRHVLAPGDDLTNECDKVKAIANPNVWTPEVIKNYKDKMEKLKGK